MDLLTSISSTLAVPQYHGDQRLLARTQPMLPTILCKHKHLATVVHGIWGQGRRRLSRFPLLSWVG